MKIHSKKDGKYPKPLEKIFFINTNSPLPDTINSGIRGVDSKTILVDGRNAMYTHWVYESELLELFQKQISHIDKYLTRKVYTEHKIFEFSNLPGIVFIFAELSLGKYMFDSGSYTAYKYIVDEFMTRYRATPDNKKKHFNDQRVSDVFHLDKMLKKEKFANDNDIILAAQKVPANVDKVKLFHFSDLPAFIFKTALKHMNHSMLKGGCYHYKIGLLVSILKDRKSKTELTEDIELILKQHSEFDTNLKEWQNCKHMEIIYLTI